MKKVMVSGAVLLAALLVYGCGRSNGGGDAPPEITEISGHGMTITKESLPGEVAELLIKGLDNGDEELLKQLVAVRRAKDEIDSIFGKYGRRSDTTFEQAAEFAVAGWMLTYAFFSKGQTRVGAAEISGDTATVTAPGKLRATGEGRDLRIEFFKEDGWWKVRHGINY